MLFNNKKRIYFKDWIDEWLSEQKNYIKESTYANYTNVVYNHLIPELGDYLLKDINNKLIQKILLDKYKNGRKDSTGGLSDKTIKDMGTLLKTSFKSAFKEELITPFDLSFNYPKNNKNNRIYVLSKIEQKKLISYIASNKNIKNLSILLTLYSGLRIGELCALKWSDIDFKKNILTVNKTLQRIYTKDNINSGSSKIVLSNPKTKNAYREIPLNNNFAVLLKEYKSNNNDYILSCSAKAIEPRSFRKYYSSILKKVNIKHFSFHSLRHTFATNCIRLGTDYKTVSELLGHSSVNITLNLYVHPQISQKKKCINSICKDLNFEEL